MIINNKIAAIFKMNLGFKFKSDNTILFNALYNICLKNSFKDNESLYIDIDIPNEEIDISFIQYIMSNCYESEFTRHIQFIQGLNFK